MEDASLLRTESQEKARKVTATATLYNVAVRALRTIPSLTANSSPKTHITTQRGGASIFYSLLWPLEPPLLGRYADNNPSLGGFQGWA
jgi:hypothetical protein